MADVHFFTICALNYIPYARVLFQTLRERRPNATFTLFLSDLPDRFDLATEPFPVVVVETMGIEEFAGMAERYGVTELSTAVKPSCFRHLFTAGAERVVYLDPDIMVTGSMPEIDALFDRGARAIVTPHVAGPIEDTGRPSELDILRAGVYNLGFLALARGEAVDSFLDWWRRRLIHDCRFDLDAGIHVDQKWCDFLPSFVDDCVVLRHPGYNAAYWNLIHRPIRRDGAGWRVGGQDLEFFHFSGLPIGGASLSRHQDRFSRGDIGDLDTLARDYELRLHVHGLEEMRHVPWAYRRAAPVAFADDIYGDLAREAMRFVGDGGLSDERRRDMIQAHVVKLEPTTQGQVAITRLMREIWSRRRDIATRYPDTPIGRLGFIRWFLRYGRRAYRVPRELETGYIHALRGELAKAGYQGRRVIDAILARLERGGGAPGPWRESIERALLRKQLRFARRNATRALDREHLVMSPDRSRGADRSAERIARFGSLKPGVLVAGYIRAESGVGELARLAIGSFRAAGVDVAALDLAHHYGAGDDRRFADIVAADFGKRVHLFSINADMMAEVNATFSNEFFQRHYNIARPLWEIEKLPHEWRDNLRHADEIWAPTTFARGIFGAAIRDRPVLLMPMAVEPAAPSGGRADFDLPDDHFVVLYSFDPASYVARKNPDAVIAAFRRAFPDPAREKATLVLKVNDTSGQAGWRPPPEAGVRVIDRKMRKSEFSGLLAAADCYLSLHRAEGIGMALAESLYFGRPVIATDYSGSRDFVTAATGIPVGFRMIDVAEGEYPFAGGQVWADPDIDQAAAALRALHGDRGRARALGDAGRELIRSRFSHAATGAAYRARLAALKLID